MNRGSALAWVVAVLMVFMLGQTTSAAEEKKKKKKKEEAKQEEVRGEEKPEMKKDEPQPAGEEAQSDSGFFQLGDDGELSPAEMDEEKKKELEKLKAQIEQLNRSVQAAKVAQQARAVQAITRVQNPTAQVKVANQVRNLRRYKF